MFRGETRNRKAEREKAMTNKMDPGLYRANPAAIHPKTIINCVFGDQGEIQRTKDLKERLIRIKPPQVCTKGIDNCMNSVKRIKALTARYYDEIFEQNHKPVVKPPRRKYKKTRLSDHNLDGSPNPDTNKSRSRSPSSNDDL